MIAYEKKSNKTRRALILSLLVVLCVSVFLLSEKMMEQGEETLVFNETVPVIKLPDDESIKLPYTVDGTIAIDYFDGKEGEVPKVVEFEGVFRPSQGIDVVYNDEAFDVIAAMSGEVVDVKEDPLLGYSVTIQSDNLKITYQSLSDIKLEKGASVNQGDVLSTAGKNVYNPQLGNHLHLIVEKDGKIVDPKSVFKLQ